MIAAAPTPYVRLVMERCTGVDMTDQWEQIQRKYCSKERQYHDIIHIEEMLVFLFENGPKLKEDGISITIPHHFNDLCLAVIYHDVVMDQAADDEARSAAMMRRHLEGLNPPRGMSRFDIDCIEVLIMMTVHHDPREVPRVSRYSDIDFRLARWLCDADLMRFAAPPDRSRLFNDMLRHEYRHLPAEVWAKGRAKALLPFLSREPFFHTSAFTTGDAKRARANIKTEIERYL